MCQLSIDNVMSLTIIVIGAIEILFKSLSRYIDKLLDTDQHMVSNWDNVHPVPR